MNDLTHIDSKGRAEMVDISAKDVTTRIAIASGRINMAPEVLEMIKDGSIPKGDVLAAARIAGIMAAKNTSGLIPLCHPLMIDRIRVIFDTDDNSIKATCEVTLNGKTGAEMEALTGVSVALLTIYDMCKAADRAMTITDVRLDEKDGGKSGHYIRQ